jgi:hypothetical protein
MEQRKKLGNDLENNGMMHGPRFKAVKAFLVIIMGESQNRTRDGT